MDTYLPDSSGINSLSGFSFQIRAFVYYMLMLKEGMQIEFETLDDVNIKNLKADEIDENDEKFKSKISGNSSNIAIQVKRTGISKDVALKVLLNWILLESSENEITKYILFTDDEYKNKDIVFNRTVEEIFKIVMAAERSSPKGTKSTIIKVKEKYINNFIEFGKTYNNIKSRYEFTSIKNIDEKIDVNCAVHFRKAANKVVSVK